MFQQQTVPCQEKIYFCGQHPDKLVRQSILPNLSITAASPGLHPQITEAICNYIIERQMLRNHSEFQQSQEFVRALCERIGNQAVGKGARFQFVMDQGTPTNKIYEQILFNLDLLIHKMGVEFFIRQPKSSSEQMLGQIKDTEYVISTTGTSGSGTFSLDFSISVGALSSPDRLHPIWKTGIDFNLGEENEIVGRIIRTGSMRKTNQKESKFDQEKAFSGFRKAFKISPQRALGYLAASVCIAFGSSRLIALSNEGACSLSTAKSVESGANYNKIMLGLGFTESPNPNWLTIGSDEFHESLSARSNSSLMLRKYEKPGLELVLETFQMSRQRYSGKLNPIVFF